MGSIGEKPARELSEADRRFVLSAFSVPRGYYGAIRAAQLSGVPERTIYHWATTNILVPDHSDERPKAWSYRDLVFLRLIAFLRRHLVPLADASEVAALYRREFSRGGGLIDTSISAAEGGYDFGESMSIDQLTGQQTFDIMANISGHFDLLVSLEDERASAMQLKHIRGPNLLRPSPRTSMSPWVMSGEPVVMNSRVETASLLALHESRGLAVAEIAELYPTLSADDVKDAIDLEQRLRAAA